MNQRIGIVTAISILLAAPIVSAESSSKTTTLGQQHKYGPGSKMTSGEKTKHPRGEKNKDNPYRKERQEKAKAHYEQQKSENETFHASIKDLSPTEKAQATIDHRNQQYQENVTFHNQQHAETMAKVRARLDQNAKIPAAEKQEILNFWETQYQKSQQHFASQHEENISALERIANDPNMTTEQVQALMKETREKQKQENQQFRQTMKAENKAERQELRSRIKDMKGNDHPGQEDMGDDDVPVVPLQ